MLLESWFRAPPAARFVFKAIFDYTRPKQPGQFSGKRRLRVSVGNSRFPGHGEITFPAERVQEGVFPSDSGLVLLQQY